MRFPFGTDGRPEDFNWAGDRMHTGHHYHAIDEGDSPSPEARLALGYREEDEPWPNEVFRTLK